VADVDPWILPLMLIIALPAAGILHFLAARPPKVKIPPTQKLTIHSALYGTGPENDKDVTDVLEKQERETLSCLR
jgi:hypothetical protein